MCVFGDSEPRFAVQGSCRSLNPAISSSWSCNFVFDAYDPFPEIAVGHQVVDEGGAPLSPTTLIDGM
jgi:hypothetical protein